DIYKISFPDGHQITFDYGDERYDMKGGYILKSIDVIYDGRYVQKTVLNSEYFIKNTIGMPINDTQKEMSRLCLRSLKQYGVDLKSEELPYEFEYYRGGISAEDIVPGSFSVFKDIYGYYNGNNSKSADGTVIPLNTKIEN